MQSVSCPLITRLSVARVEARPRPRSDLPGIVHKAGDGNKLVHRRGRHGRCVIIYSHQKVFNTFGLTSSNKWGSGGTVDGAQAMLLGAQAGGLAIIGNMFWRETDKTD
jgi:hypothetical protein